MAALDHQAGCSAVLCAGLNNIMGIWGGRAGAAGCDGFVTVIGEYSECYSCTGLCTVIGRTLVL